MAARPHRLHGRGLMHREVDQQRAGQVESREDVEVRGQAQVIGERRRDQPADQIARDIARDVGGEGAGRVGGAVFLAEIGERQRECRGHEDALHDAQQREGAEPGRHGQQRRRYGEQREADQDAEPAVDAPARTAPRPGRRPPCPWCWR